MTTRRIQMGYVSIARPRNSIFRQQAIPALPPSTISKADDEPKSKDDPEGFAYELDQTDESGKAGSERLGIDDVNDAHGVIPTGDDIDDDPWSAQQTDYPVDETVFPETLPEDLKDPTAHIIDFAPGEAVGGDGRPLGALSKQLIVGRNGESRVSRSAEPVDASPRWLTQRQPSSIAWGSGHSPYPVQRALTKADAQPTQPDLDLARKYLKPGESAPQGTPEQTGERGGRFFDDDEGGATPPGGGGAGSSHQAVQDASQLYVDSQRARSTIGGEPTTDRSASFSLNGKSYETDPETFDLLRTLVADFKQTARGRGSEGASAIQAVVALGLHAGRIAEKGDAGPKAEDKPKAKPKPADDKDLDEAAGRG